MKTTILHVGIMSKEDYKKRTIAIAKGQYTPKNNEPKIWFQSAKVQNKYLIPKNKSFLKY